MNPKSGEPFAPTLGRRPGVGEIRDYYSRPEVLNELLAGMKRWHVRFVPGYRPQRWVYTEDRKTLRATLMEPLDALAAHPERTEYPYFRINEARHRPAHVWEEDRLWGYDFVIEKDSRIWQACFEAMLPVMDILEHFGVHYWLKYSGHHSLHLIVPAEVFPTEVNGVPLTACHKALYHRLRVFLNKRADQFYNAHDRHCPPGTNMPYSVNEDTGLVNLPLRREELAGFRPWQANIYLAPVRGFWRTVPEGACGGAAELLAEVMKPSPRQFRVYPPVFGTSDVVASGGSCPPRVGTRFQWDAAGARAAVARSGGFDRIPDSPSDGNDLLSREKVEMRRLGAWVLMLAADASFLPSLRAALFDPDRDVRWFAAEGLVRLGARLAPSELLAIPPDDMVGSAFADLAVLAVPEVVPALARWLKAHPKSRWETLPVDEALVRIGGPARSAVRALTEDTNARVRKRAVAILEEITGTPSLEEVLVLSDTHHRRHEGAQRLGWFDDPAAWSRLAELLTDRNVRARCDAVKALLWTDHPERLHRVRGMLNDAHPKVRRRAAWALKLLEGLPERKDPSGEGSA